MSDDDDYGSLSMDSIQETTDLMLHGAGEPKSSLDQLLASFATSGPLEPQPHTASIARASSNARPIESIVPFNEKRVGGRYFEEPVTPKAQVVPCYLCGRPKHGPARCPFKLCVHCGQTHPSESCENKFGAALKLCVLCGRIGHFCHKCPFGEEGPEERYEGRCLLCNEIGHFMCSVVDSDSSEEGELKASDEDLSDSDSTESELDTQLVHSSRFRPHLQLQPSPSSSWTCNDLGQNGFLPLELGSKGKPNKQHSKRKKRPNKGKSQRKAKMAAVNQRESTILPSCPKPQPEAASQDLSSEQQHPSAPHPVNSEPQHASAPRPVNSEPQTTSHNLRSESQPAPDPQSVYSEPQVVSDIHSEPRVRLKSHPQPHTNVVRDQKQFNRSKNSMILFDVDRYLSRQRTRYCSVCSKTGHFYWRHSTETLRKLQVDNDSLVVASQTMVCFRCGEAGHRRVDCPSRDDPCSRCGSRKHNLSTCPYYFGAQEPPSRYRRRAKSVSPSERSDDHHISNRWQPDQSPSTERRRRKRGSRDKSTGNGTSDAESHSRSRSHSSHSQSSRGRKGSHNQDSRQGSRKSSNKNESDARNGRRRRGSTKWEDDKPRKHHKRKKHDKDKRLREDYR